jgi:flavin-dependent dehydrogenase
LGSADESWDLVIVGGGPAGLATAIVAAEQDLNVLVLERRDLPMDKVCGEGILPPGVRALEQLGVTPLLDPSQFHPFTGIRFIQEDGTAAEGWLPREGLGIRRTVLVEAMTRRAAQAGAVIRHRCEATSVERNAAESIVQTRAGKMSARLVVAADGLRSPLRRVAGLEAEPNVRRRFALRQHYQIRPWTDLVEVYVDSIGEGVVTPVSPDSINVNFTWEHGAIAEPTITSLAARFPKLQERLRGAPPLSPVEGAGPMGRPVKGRTAERLTLIGDASGFVDSISGEGLSIAFNSALALGKLLPEMLARGATRESLAGYEKLARRRFRAYRTVTNVMLWLARHPRARSAAIRYLAKHGRIFNAMMGAAMKTMAPAG